jgi:hypothetical protein
METWNLSLALAQSEILPILIRNRKAVNTDDVNYSLSTSS